MSSDDTNHEISLSLEELGLLINLMGYPAVAKGLLTSQLGDMRPDEERGRLLAANHTLLAKNMLALDDGVLRIDPVYSSLLDLLPNNDYAVRCVISSEDNGAQMLTFYVRDSQVVRQRIDFGAVHSFRHVPSVALARDAVLDLLGIDFDQSQLQNTYVLSYQDLLRLLDAKAGTESVSAYLQTRDWGVVPADMYAVDLIRPRRRAIVYRVAMNPEQEEQAADRGFMLLLGASNRAWLMEFSGELGEAMLAVQPATVELLRQSIATLLTMP